MPVCTRLALTAIFAMVMSNLGPAQISGDLTATETDSFSIMDLPFTIPTVLIEDCTDFNFNLILVPVTFTYSANSNTFDYDVDWNWIDFANNYLSLVPTNFSPPGVFNVFSCSRTRVTELGHLSGNVGLYSFHIGGGGPKGFDFVGTITANQTFAVNSLQAGMLELPLHIGGDTYAAESFGHPIDTYGKASMELTANVNGASYGPFKIETESITVIPEMHQISTVTAIQVPVSPGQTTVSVAFNGEVKVTTRAQSAGLGGFLSGSATAGANFPGSISLGNFTGPGGGPLPPCTRIEATTSGFTVAWTDGTVYCTAKTNSLGCVPAIEPSGTPSASASTGFTVRARNVLNGKSHLLFYSTAGPDSVPFQGGTLCVAPPLRRTVIVNSGGNPPPANDCSGVASIDMNSFAQGALGGNPAPELGQIGTRVWCQWWGRDPAAVNNSSLSDGLEYSICQ